MKKAIKKTAARKPAVKRVKVADYDAITVNVKAQDAKLNNIDRITAEVGAMRIALAALIYAHVKPDLRTADAKQLECKRLVTIAKKQIMSDGYHIQHDKNLWSTVTNALNLHLFSDVKINVEDKIVDGKQTFKKVTSGDVLAMTARKINNSASSLKIAAKIGDKRGTNTAANKPANKAKRAARVPQEARKAAATIKESGWSSSITAAFGHADSSAELVKALIANKQKLILAFNKAGYSVAIESVVPVVAASRKAARKVAAKKPAARKVSAAALKKAAAAKQASI